MSRETAHLSERDLVLAADGELSAKRRVELKAHLESCWTCRERMQALESTITDFVRARNHVLSEQLPPLAESRAMFRARLDQLDQIRKPARGFALPSTPVGRLAAAGAAFGAAILAVVVIFGTTVNAEGPKPKSGLTPGETRPVSLAEVCRDPQAEVVTRNIPEATREKVFAAYGISAPQPNQFEVDYLIPPDLGGANSIRNLWPQPYSARWNARVKDRLEQRLHQLVCSDQLDLATAQRDIAVDWIGAYKKYVGAR